MLRHLDLVLLVLALPIFIAADLPIAGYAGAALAWLAQRLVKAAVDRRAAASDDVRTVAGLVTASMIGRGWLAALTIFGVGMSAGKDAGLAAAVLFLVVFTVHFTLWLVLRPFEEAERLP